MRNFNTFLNWYEKTIDSEMKSVVHTCIRRNDSLYVERALFDLFKLHKGEISERFNALIEDYGDDHDSIGELFHKMFRQADIVMGYDSIIWDLLTGVTLFWDVLARFNRGDKTWEDYIWEWD